MSLSTIFSTSYFGSAILTLMACYLTWHLWKQRPKNSPPGTNGYPVIGVISSMGKYTERTMAKWAKQYGPIYMIKVGLVDVVVISSPEIAYEAYAKSEYFNDRPNSIAAISDSKGIVFINKTDIHTEQRRFGLNTLRLFGMGRRTLEPQLIVLSSNLCNRIDSLCAETNKAEPSQPIDIQPMIYEITCSVISCMIFGSDITAEDEEFKKLLKRLSSSNKLSFLSAVMIFAPFLKYIFPFSYVWRKGKQFQGLLHQAIEKEVDKHAESIDYKNPRDFIDCFLTEIQKLKQDQDNEKYSENSELWKNLNDEEFVEEKGNFSSDWQKGSSFDIDQLIGVVRDLFIAGTETTANTILWIILYLAKFPKFQRKMQEEIDDVLGHSGVPHMTSMEKMPYVRAVIQEILRIRPVVPLSVPHKAARDSKLRTYQIPKGAIILTNIWGIHHDEKLWSQPEKFMPERHLDSDGKFIRSDNWMPFSVGGRNCLGQQLAKMELFITTVMLFQRFEISLETGNEPDLAGQSIVSLRPYDFKVFAMLR